MSRNTVSFIDSFPSEYNFCQNPPSLKLRYLEASRKCDKMSHLIFGGKNYLYFEPSSPPSPSDLINWQRGGR